MKLSLLHLFLLATGIIQAQNLLPSIGLSTPPNDSDPICFVPYYDDPDGTYMTTGRQTGDTVPDFTLYDMANNAVTLSDQLNNGKYVLLISGSYTCPVFRNKIQSINQIIQNYSADVAVFVIYEMEAHPAVDTSFYFNYVNPGIENTNAGILYEQPDTYGERKNMVNILNDSLQLYAPLLLDGPCNEYLNNFGFAPNNAYLIDTNGIIVVKHGWFDKYPLDMSDDIDSVLGISGGTPPGVNGTFSFQLSTDTIVYGYPGDIIAVQGDFTNTHATDDVYIQIQRLQNNLPDTNWHTSMCVNACLGEGINTTFLVLPAGASQHFVFYFFTGSEASADAKLQFSNQNVTGNNYNYQFYGVTDSTLSITNYSVSDFTIYPNPFDNYFIISGLPSSIINSILITDVSGRIVSEINDKNKFNESLQIESSMMVPGIYFVSLITDNGMSTKKITKY